MKLVNTLLRFYDHEMSGEIKYMIEEHFNYDVNVDKVEVGYVDVSFWGNGNCEIDILLNTGKKLLDKSQRDYVRVLVLNYIFTVLSFYLSQAGVKISDDVMYFDEEVYNYFEDIKIEIENETDKKVATHLKFYDNLSSIPKYKDLSYYEDSVKEFSKEIKKKVDVVKVSHTTQPCSLSNMKKKRRYWGELL